MKRTLTMVLAGTLLFVPALSFAAGNAKDTFTCKHLKKDLALESTGGDVRWLQDFLKTFTPNEYISEVVQSTGKFDTVTERATQQFQSFLNKSEVRAAYKIGSVPEDGIVGSQTRSAIKKFCPAILVSKARAANALIHADMSTLQIEAELYYDSHQNSYGESTSCAQGMFASGMTRNTTLANASSICRSKSTSFVAYAPLKTKGYWCVDSTGFSKEIKKIPSKKSFSCNGKVERQRK